MINHNIHLFVCSGAFDGLEKIVETRLDRKSIGFNADITENVTKEIGEIFKEVTPQDLIKFGLIPEFVFTTDSLSRMRSSPSLGMDPV